MHLARQLSKVLILIYIVPKHFGIRPAENHQGGALRPICYAVINIAQLAIVITATVILKSRYRFSLAGFATTPELRGKLGLWLRDGGGAQTGSPTSLLPPLPMKCEDFVGSEFVAG